MAVVSVWYTVVLATLSGYDARELTITIFPEFLSQENHSRFDPDRFQGHNGFDDPKYFPANKAIGTQSSRWINPDLNFGIYENATEDSNRQGYPDPNYFQQSSIQRLLGQNYVKNLNGYGREHMNTVMTLNGKVWPKWMNTSLHGGLFPNNLDAGAELAPLMIGALRQYTRGPVPPSFEVINEPDAMYQVINWTTVIEWHRITAAKVKSAFPAIKVGGPTMTGAIASANENGFTVWKNLRQFLDMSMYEMDFFSFHPYSPLYANNQSHYFRGTNEARLVAIIDLVESYAHEKLKRSIPLITSEYGLGGRFVDASTPSNVIRWAYAYQHNGYMFTFLNHRDAMYQPVAFLMTLALNRFEDASILLPNGSYAFVANAYRFWNNFNKTHRFLRVESQYDYKERVVSPLVLAEPVSKTVTVLLHNYEQSNQQVYLNFSRNWVPPFDAKSTCMFLDSTNTPRFTENKPVRILKNKVNLLPEASCLFTFQTAHDFTYTPTVEQYTHYAIGQAIEIVDNKVQATVNVPSNNFYTLQMRVGVSSTDLSAQTVPTYAYVNGQLVSKYYLLFDADRPSSSTLWDVIVYDVPTTALRQGENNVTLIFKQNGGYVSTIAFHVGAYLSAKSTKI